MGPWGVVKRAKIVKNSENRQKICIWDGFWILDDGPRDSTSTCLKMNNTKTKPLMRYGCWNTS